MIDTLRHRGPDSVAVFSEGPIALAHARLSIIDLSAAANQPMTSACGRYVLAYNGELYNFRELRRELSTQGLTFSTQSDTEVVLQSLIHWGPDALHRFDGMFALAIWDKQRRRLLLGRDRFGIKPLYVWANDDCVVFGSEIKALLAHPAVERRLNLDALHEYLYFGSTLGRHTLFDGVERLPPASAITFEGNTTNSKVYFRIQDLPKPRAQSLQDIERELQERLEASVTSQLIADVPVGVFLSGGIDSSCITAFASRAAGTIDTYSAGFDFSPHESELAGARSVARHFGTRHHELQVSCTGLPSVIETLVRSHDQPFGDAANVPLFLLCRELGGSPRVILQGDGGDEIFAGYRRYSILELLPYVAPLAPFVSAIHTTFPHTTSWFRRQRLLDIACEPETARRLALLLTVETPRRPVTRVLDPRWRRQVEAANPFRRYQEVLESVGTSDAVQAMLHTDCQIILPDIFFEKVDRASMASSTEVRVPLLGNAITDFVLPLPARFKVRRGEKKWLLRRALRGVVPDHVLDAPKVGFGVPYQNWLRGPLVAYARDVLLDTTTLNACGFDQGALEAAITGHVNRSEDNGFLLWKLLNLALWMRFYGMNVSNASLSQARRPASNAVLTTCP